MAFLRITLMQMVVIGALALAAAVIHRKSIDERAQVVFAEQPSGREEASGAESSEAEQEDSTVVLTISVEEAAELFDVGMAQFVDARLEVDFREGHIPHSLNLPFSAFASGMPEELDRRLAEQEWLTELTTVVYCEGGDCDSSKLVARQLVAFGFSDVRIIGAGFPEWRNQGLPVESGEGDQNVGA
jgi:3-mercaptopyruvate sulfurtransferase SseA